MFENANGVKGISQLVRVGVQENREGWKFWTRDVEDETEVILVNFYLLRVCHACCTTHHVCIYPR